MSRFSNAMPPISGRHWTLRELGVQGVLGALLLAALLLLGSFAGPHPIVSAPPWTDPVWRLRAWRLLAAAIVGMALGTAGAALQGLLRNPLADPYVLGVATGAGIGVRIGHIGVFAAWMGSWRTPVLAMAGALATTAMVPALAWRGARRDPWSIVLAGVMMNVLNGAVLMALYLWADPDRLDEFARWSMGELPDIVEPGQLAMAVALVLPSCTAMMFAATALNALALGEEVAHTTGVAVVGIRLFVCVVVGVLTAAAVAVAGPVGFVGLLAPHSARALTGPDHRRLLPTAAVVGAVLVMTADVLARTVGHWLGLGRVPTGLVTALFGVPVFLGLLHAHTEHRMQ